jgi:predicted nucleotidyltransferase
MKPEVLGAGYYKLSELEKIALTKRITTYLFQRAEIVFAFLYGSFLTEKFFRDIDVGVFVRNRGPSGGFSYENKLAYDLEQEFDFLLPLEIRIINAAPVTFIFQVIRGKLLFSRDEEFLTDFMEATARKYLDMDPLRRRYLKEVMA